MLIAVIAVLTFNYVADERNKAPKADPTKSSIPTVQDNKPQPEPPKTPPARGAVEPQRVVQARIPAAGPSDTFLPVRTLGLRTGWYLVSRRISQSPS